MIYWTASGLTDAADRRVSTYSGGMRRRLDVAMSLIGKPQLIFLDEPTTGLDPEGRIEVWKIVKELADGGTTVFLTTQYLEEAEQLADRIAILHEGKIIRERHTRGSEKAVPARKGGICGKTADIGGDIPRYRRYRGSPRGLPRGVGRRRRSK